MAAGGGPRRRGAVWLDRLAVAAGWSLFALAVLVAVEVVLRKAATASLKGVDEIGGYVLAIVSAVGFVHALLGRGHIRIDLLLNAAGPRLRVHLHLLAYASLAAFAGLLLWGAAGVWLKSWALDAIAPTPLQTPLVYPQGVWLIALAAFAAAAAACVFGLLRTLVREGARAADRRYGVSDVRDEVREEQARIAARRTGDGDR